MAFGVQYVSIPVRLKHPNSVPNRQQLNRFIDTYLTYSTMNPNQLIGVHDRLGNRTTAYMICKALEPTGLSSMKLAMKRFKDARGYGIYASMAGVLNGSRRPWIPKSKIKSEMERANSKKKTKKQRKAERRGKKQIKSEGADSKKNTKKQRRAMQREKDKITALPRAAQIYKNFLTSL